MKINRPGAGIVPCNETLGIFHSSNQFRILAVVSPFKGELFCLPQKFFVI